LNLSLKELKPYDGCHLFCLAKKIRKLKMRGYAHIHIGWKFFWKQVYKLFHNPVFIVLTIIGNGLMVVGAGVFYALEAPSNANVRSFLDALWWAVTTVTTVGYGDIIPQTAAGKILGILLMIAGTAIFAGFTGLFASALIAPEVDDEVRSLRNHLDRVKLKKNGTT